MSDNQRPAPVLQLVVEDSTEVPISALRVASFAPGSLVAGKYLVERELGEGGLGIVVQARHLSLEQSVAIKYVKPIAVSLPGVVERFVREARLAAQIRSQYAVKVHDVDTLDGVPYMVMEYLEGRTLGEVIDDEGALPLERAVDYLLQASEALAEAHAAGVVHRDLKPDNLFLAQRAGGSAIVKILDFGISKVLEEERPARGSVPPPDPDAPARPASDDREKYLTRVNDKLGTPAFMSPEQLQSSTNVDARSDIWALGVSLYELVTRRLPFDGPDVTEISKAVLTRPPIPLRAVMPNAPAALESVVRRCLEKDRDKRYANVAEFAQDLAQLWTAETPSRVLHITKVMREGLTNVRSPTPPPGSIRISPLPGISSRPPASAVTAIETAAPRRTLDSVVAVFTDEAGAVVDELHFASMDEAYDYACTLDPSVVRCEVYDVFAEARGKHRATYVRKGGAEHWLPLLP